MEKEKYPVGIQDFSTIRKDGYVYVDKTMFMAKLVESGKYYFLSRPRRFGKSLLLSTFHAFFEGKRDLFKGLAIDGMEHDWLSYPVFHFDFNTATYSEPHALEERLSKTLSEYERRWNVTGGESVDFALRFEHLISSVHDSTGMRVVILIDEYDKALLTLDPESKLYQSRQGILKGFLDNLKSMDRYIKFAFLTGVARFSKVSIFSDVNNLSDISLMDEFSDICGITEGELVSTFSGGISALADKRGETFEETLTALRVYYDGYLFSGNGRKVYNPFSVLSALKAEEIVPYWFETGTPTFLARKVKDNGIDVLDLNDVECEREDLLALDSGRDNSIPMMFQTGYLTIASYSAEDMTYTLRFPNKEVEIGFFKYLLPAYTQTEDKNRPFSITPFRKALRDGNPDDFMNRLKALVKDLPFEVHSEATYQSVAYMVCVLSATDVRLESHTFRGRIDMTVFTSNYIYLFEFKFNRNSHIGIRQIHDRDYAGGYAADSRKIYLIAANFSDSKENRGLTDYSIEVYKK